MMYPIVVFQLKYYIYKKKKLTSKKVQVTEKKYSSILDVST